MPINYQNSKIYKIYSTSLELTYYGSTTQPLNKRMYGHRKRNDGCTSKSLIDAGDAVISLVESYPCDRKEELIARERYYIEGNECVNKRIPGRKRAEWYAENREKCAAYSKEYHVIHKKRLKEYSAKYNAANRVARLKASKKYRRDNPEKCKMNNSPATCKCGKVMGRLTMRRQKHLKSRAHIAGMEAINNEAADESSSESSDSE
jgi:hypothetical protein